MFNKLKQIKNRISDDNRYLSSCNEGRVLIPFLSVIDGVDYLIVNRDLIFVWDKEDADNSTLINFLLSKGFDKTTNFSIKHLAKNTKVTDVLNVKRYYNQSFNIDLVILDHDLVDIAKEVNVLLSSTGLDFSDKDASNLFIKYMDILNKIRS